MPEGAVRESESAQARSEQPPVIITCAITGDHQQSANPNLPVTLDEQVSAASAAVAAGASIIHIHGRRADDPTKPAVDAGRYREINDAIREAAPGALVDNTQLSTPLTASPVLAGQVSAWTDAIIGARPDITSLNPGPMTFRGSGSSPSRAFVTTFDETARIAARLRDAGIKPQVFIYHPGHLDLLSELIRRDVLAAPYFVQLVFGQQSGIPATPDAFFFTVRRLPVECVFQTCALGFDAIEFNVLAILYGGHVRTGMEDALFYREGELATGNGQLVARIVGFARELGRPVATLEQTRQLLRLG